ncbi:putative dehydrogenase [Kribbella sp. VKM Ac-2527]|uniref:Putative dehydrogenase n=1 Tax=Kribbella caucasensis TaxID=2512215 RepID=A0A4R6K5U7_9ACTN|nr:Gfo/Idh/MocA family oxidoreductase [Kribbella sp. VKM Ac-2527]TDO43186.1 putative dehydrogenase [Kribbella sp. VKM Ac-2527]
MQLPRVAVAGVHGHGASHVRRVAGLAADGQVELVAVADPVGTATFPDLASLLAATEVDVVVISTPIQTHVPLAELALRAGADVLLEKPPTASLAEFEHLLAVVDETGRACQVGFQVHGSAAARGLADLVADGKLGEVRGIGAVGTWIRTQEYWQRARWAGRRMLDGVAVVDGAVTNAFAHASATALLIDGSGPADQIVSVETELYRANPIEADDTSTVRIRTARGTTILSALTLCAEEPGIEPTIIVHGSDGRAVLRYPSDRLEVTIDGRTTSTQYGREDLLGNLLAHRADPGVPLFAPLAELGGFTRVLEAVRTSPPPTEIEAEFISWQAEGSQRHPVVLDVGKWVGQAAETLSLFSELGAPWSKNLRETEFE